MRASKPPLCARACARSAARPVLRAHIFLPALPAILHRQFAPSAVKQAKALLEGKAARFVEYPLMHHGFAVRGGAHTLEAREKCAKEVCDFFAAALA